MAKKIPANLVRAVEDINEFVVVEPIEFKGMTKNEVVQELIDVAELIDEDNREDLALTTIQTLEEIGALETEGKSKPKKSAAKDKPKVSKKTAPKANGKASKAKATPKTAPKKTEKVIKPNLPKASTKEKTKAADKPAKEKGPKVYKVRKAREGGVIQAIFNIIEKAGDKGITREKILEKMEKKFPGRDPKGMALTINQETSPAALEYRQPLQVNEKGKFSIA